MEKEINYNLTTPQKTIWNTRNTFLNNPITNISGTCIINQKVDFELLEKAINKAIKENDALRIKIRIVNNEPKQYVEEYKQIKVELIKTDKINFEHILNEKQSKPLDIEDMVRFTMYEFEDGTGSVNIIINHLLSDAWSATLICSQVAENYDELLNKDVIEKNNYPSYIDFIKEEEEYINSEKYLKDKEFWEEYLNEIPEEVASLKQKENTDILDTKAERKEVGLDRDYSIKIKKFCQENKISPYVFFLGVYSIYLSKITSQNNLIINTPILNRKNIKEKQTVGMFVNSLPLKINLQESEAALNLFKEIAKDSLMIFRHQRYSYFEILKYLRSKDNNNLQIYDNVFSYQNATSKPTKNNLPYTSKWYFNGNITETLNIHVSDLDSTDSFNVYYDYKVSQLSEKDILNINERLIKISNQILNNKNIKLRDVSILSDKDIEDIKVLNNTGIIEQSNENINTIIETICKKYSDNIAIKCGDNKISYKKFFERINSLAALLRNRGVRENTPVAIMLDKSIEMIIAMFSIIRAGGYYIPILPEENQNRINYILSDSKPIGVITQKQYYNKIKNNKIIDINEENADFSIINQINKPDDILYMIYTSGSTGNPKGTQIMHKNVCGLNNSMRSDELLRPTSEDVSMSLLKYSFDASGIDIYSSLLNGGTLLLINKENELNPQMVVKIMQEEKVTRSFLIPKWVEQIALEDERQGANLENLKILGTGGESLKPNNVKNLYNKYSNLKIINLYGPTETTMFTSYKVQGRNEFKNNNTTIGKPIKFSRCLLLNDNNCILPINSKGELVIYEDEKSIHNIANGYLNLNEITSEKFINVLNPITNKMVKAYKTGDIVRINNNFEIEYIGRKDDMVKINGSYLIAINEVENTILKLINAKYKIAVAPIPYNNTKILIGFVENVSENEVLGMEKFINKNITFYMRPQKIIAISEFPRNYSGKIDRKKLKEIAIETVNNFKKEIVLPKTQTEQIIYNIIKKHTNVENISIKDDYLNDLGIDSLSLASIYTDLAFYKISLQDLYTYSTIESLAKFITTGKEMKYKYNIKNLPIKNEVKSFDLRNILLTGVTGFLGIHILKELLLNNKVEKIYCIIRNKEFKTGKERLEERINYYYGKDDLLNKMIEQKVEVINGNITKKKLDLDDNLYSVLKEKITTVINSAANVRHYCKIDELLNDNLNSVKNLIDFCGNNISLAHISTLSIAGFKNDKTIKKVFDENTFYLKQDFNNNPYLISKCLAEQEILKFKKLNCKIFRVGNIMPRYSDGKFQLNDNQNAFMNAIKNVINIKKIPDEIMDTKVEFSPVDECALSIMKLIESNNKNKIYHIVNNKELTIKELFLMFNKLNCSVNVVPINDFMNEIDKQDQIGNQYIKEYIIQNNINDYSSNNTVEILNELNFEWSDINLNYIKNILKLLR